MKVWPRNEEIRKVLKHGVIGFPAEGPAEWPDDTFTHRRIMDGDVMVEEHKREDKPKVTPSTKSV